MNKGVYLALSGAVNKQRQLDVITQNLANVSTTGYKRDTISFRDHLIRQVGSAPDGRTMSKVAEVKTDYSEGNFIKTDNPLDVSLAGDGFFVLDGDRYTRRGDFLLSTDGYLMSKSGRKVMGQGGPILLPEGVVDISADGAVSVDGVEVARLQLVGFMDKTVLQRRSGEEFYTTARPDESAAEVRQGYLETSNVDAVTEMVRMITTLREFETYQKIIRSLDEASSKVNNEMPT